MSTGLADDPSRQGMARVRKWSCKNDCQWRRWILIMVFEDFCSNTKVIRYQAPAWGWPLKTTWCEMTRIFRLCLGFDSHTASFWPNHSELRCVPESCPKPSVAPTQKPAVAPPSPRIRLNLRKQNASHKWLQCSELCCVDWSSVSSKSPQNWSPITAWTMKNVCSCWLLTTVSWPLNVHGPRHLNCGTGMAGQRNKGQLQAVIVETQKNHIVLATACLCFWLTRTCFKKMWPFIRRTHILINVSKRTKWNQQAGYNDMELATANCFGSLSGIVGH